jgi:putative membrane protein
MINYNPKSWLHLIFALHKSDTLRILWKEMIYICFFTLFITFVVLHYYPKTTVLSELKTVFSLIGFVISLLLVFRTNTAYDRWWEGRRKWGELINDSRNLASKLATILNSKEDKDFFKRMITNFAYSSKDHLRNGVLIDELDLIDNERNYLLNQKHIPLAISQLMYARLFQLKHNKEITENDFLIIDKNLNNFMDCVGACERIKNTPIPFSYSLFIKKFIFIYVTTLPLAFVTIFGYASAFIATYVFYVLVSMEVLAEEIEDPFGTDDNDLPVDTMCERIKESSEQMLA